MKQQPRLFNFKDKHKDKTGIIIGGGPSIKQLIDSKFQFSELNKLYTTIGTNMSYTIVDTDYLLFMDRYFWHTFYKDIDELKCTIKLTQLEKEYGGKLKRPLSSDIVRIQRKGVFYPLIDGKNKCNNTGSAALSFANYIGLKKIYLFGFDMCLDKENNKNFHNEYKSKSKSIPLTNANISNHYTNIGKIIGELTEKHDTKIYSCSKISRLNKYIPYVNPMTLITQ